MWVFTEGEADALAGDADARQAIRDALGDGDGVQLLADLRDLLAPVAAQVERDHGIPAAVAAVLVAEVAQDAMRAVRDTLAGIAEADGHAVGLIGATVLPGRNRSNTRRAIPGMLPTAEARRQATQTGHDVLVTLPCHPGGPDRDAPGWSVLVPPAPSA